VTGEPAAGDDLLIAFAEAYLRQAARMSPGDLRRRQPSPLASLSYGAAGIATTFLRAHRASGRASHLAHARRWSAAAWTARRRRDSFDGPKVRGRSGSVPFGPAGLAFVEVRVAAAAGPSAARLREQRLREFLTACRPRRGAPQDFMQGLAGRLDATATLDAELGDPRLRRLGDRLAAGLLDGGATVDDEPGFAVGSAGAHHALLRWSLATGFELPGWFFDSLDQVMRTPVPPVSPSLKRSWCNGTAGIAMLAVAAYQRTGRRADLDLARAAAADAASDDVAASSNLCCGLGGRAYALLALDRIDPGGGWSRRARELAVAAVSRPFAEYPNGLLKGNAGLVYLAIELFEEAPPRFPLAEG